jgi:two-component system NtrC family sensor kinase
MWLVPLCAALVLAVGSLQMRLVLHVAPPLAAYLVPVLVGAAFGWLLSRILGLRNQLRATVAELRRSATEVDALNKKLEVAVEETRSKLSETEGQLRQVQKLDALGRLAGGVAHDFNNVLTAIMAGATMAGAHSDEAGRDLLAEVLLASKRGADLTSQLLTFGRAGQHAKEAVDVNEQVAVTLPMLRRIMGPEVSVDWVPGSNLSPVFVDPGQLGQVLMNLVINARDASSSGAVVRVSSEQHATADGERVRIAVADSGAGMDAETRDRAFEPFFTTKARGEGTGLGLSVVYGIVRDSGGAIHIDSAVGQGTTVTVEFPVATAADAVDAPATTQPAP